MNQWAFTGLLTGVREGFTKRVQWWLQSSYFTEETIPVKVTAPRSCNLELAELDRQLGKSENLFSQLRRAGFHSPQRFTPSIKLRVHLSKLSRFPFPDSFSFDPKKYYVFFFHQLCFSFTYTLKASPCAITYYSCTPILQWEGTFWKMIWTVGLFILLRKRTRTESWEIKVST